MLFLVQDLVQKMIQLDDLSHYANKIIIARFRQWYFFLVQELVQNLIVVELVASRQ